MRDGQFIAAINKRRPADFEQNFTDSVNQMRAAAVQRFPVGTLLQHGPSRRRAEVIGHTTFGDLRIRFESGQEIVTNAVEWQKVEG